jgi:hypothetical protein
VRIAVALPGGFYDVLVYVERFWRVAPVSGEGV